MKPALDKVLLLALLSWLSACTMPTQDEMKAELDDDYQHARTEAHTVAHAAGVVAKENASEALGHAYNLEQAGKGGFYGLTDHLANWLRPTQAKGLQPVPPSYCYRVLQDVLCYRQPMPDAEHRLVAWQGTGAKAPPPAMMELLKKQAPDPSQLPANRVASARPVFVEAPPVIAEPEKPAEGDITGPTPETTHEQLPDPALAPQL